MKKLTNGLLIVLARVYFFSPIDAVPGLADDMVVFSLMMLAVTRCRARE